MANEKKTMALRADVPLDWYSGVQTTLHGQHMAQGTLGGNLLSTACAALDNIYSCYANIKDVKRATFQATAVPLVMDKMGKVVEGQAAATLKGVAQRTGREAEVARAMGVAFNRLSPKVQSAVETMKKQKLALAKALDGKFTGGSSEWAHEIRHHFSRDLQGALRTIKEGDDAEALAVCRALLRPGAPRFISGFSNAQYDLIRTAAAARFAPVEHEQLSRADRIISAVENARDSFVKKYKAELPAVKKAAAADDALANLVK